ncbi:DUF5979 domain-containing protein [Cellulomonas sp. PhB150]|uniref:DUF5979 domain-containing protein n=1 Tax=Cellulomonas sp. PhB150 TaxID=2485188 RepID=UPI000F49EFBF|nr:DUF5979 domain-containing protein [Cellulomonas sp. PhB150]
MRHARRRHERPGIMRWVSTLAAAVLVAVPLAVIPATSASAAAWGIQKVELSDGPYEPGDTVQWGIEVSCSDPNGVACANSTITDPMPPGLDLVDVSIQSPAGGTTSDADNTATVNWPSIPNGTNAEIIVTAQVDPDLPYSENGVPITNTATVTADNASAASDSDDITPVVPLVLDSDTTKSIAPAGAIASPGTPATVTIGATNTSNDPADTLVVQDPVDPTADPNPFTYLQYTGTGDVVLPPNATDVDEEYWDGDSWEPLTDATPPEDVQGVRYTFSGDIQPGATATIPVQVEQSDAVTDLTDATTVTNDASSYVTHDDDESTPTTADDTYVITPPNNSVTASKSFDPPTVSAGDPTTVTIGATNDGDPTTSMTITEPAPGTDSPFEGDDPLTFTGFGSDGDGAGVQWPADADTAVVTFTCADGSTPEETSTTPDTLPDPPAGCDVTGFSIEFTGDLVTGAEASIPFTADTDPDQTVDDVDHPNEIAAEIPNADDTADATLTTLTDRLATNTTKSISPSTIPALPGQTVVVQLPSQLEPFGPDGSTTDANDVVIQDPTDPADPGEFWSDFTATSVRSTDVPAGSTLTISYWNGTEWVTDPDCGTFTGPTTVNCDLPADAQGVQFSYHSDDGFPPGTSFQPNFVAAYDGPEDRDDPIANCGASSASAGTVAPTTPAEGCDTVDPFPVPTDPGDLDFLDKTFLPPAGQSGAPYSVRARTEDQLTAQLTWSTNGFDGVDPMVLSDISDPAGTPIADSFYDAFDLVRVQPIDGSVDPLMQYDAITGVELYVAGAWVDAVADPCSVAAPCVGSFPGYTLTDDESASATSVRLTYTASPSRAQFPSDPTVPAAGDGVARSTQADGRHLDLTFQVRDDKRSDGSPVLGTTNGTIYNAGEAGLVNDTASATATFQGTERTDVDGDDVLILDEPINVGITKEWTGGPLSVPPDGTPAGAYPSTHAIITATNNSVARVDTLAIAEPSSENDDNVVEPDVAPGTAPFDAFTLTAIDVTVPDGTATTTITLTSVGGGTADYTEAEAEALTAAQLADVVGVEATFDGRVESQAEGALDLTLRLREFDRYEPTTRVDVAGYSPVPNSAGAEVTDPGGTTADAPVAWDDAQMVLDDAEISLEETKSFAPSTIVEPGSDAEPNPISTLTITGQPTGPSRAVEMTLTDVDGSFWNQYDLVGFDASALTAPIDQVQVDAYTGGTYSEATDTFTGGTWTEGDPAGTFALPDGVDAADVTGLRFTFTRADGAIWENPANPVQPVNLEVQVRDALRSDPGTPVPSDLTTNDPAPGEDAPGLATNDVTSTVTGADLVSDGQGGTEPVSSDDDTSATITYQHTENSVEIVKDFNGTVTGGTANAGAVVPMNITVTNTGNRPIYDPVIVDDPMPSDPDGPLLRLADVDQPYSYALTGAAPSPTNGPAMPTDPDDVDVDRTGNIFGLTFTFPAGTVLEVEQSYTITVQVEFRVGLASGTVVRNTAAVTGDRPWDGCAARLDDDTGACEADADITPLPSAVLAQTKVVKPTIDDDELGVITDPDAPDPSVSCTQDSRDVLGFYAYPCTPVIAPGHDETWQVRVENVGNLPLSKLVMYDRLPAPGDTGSIGDDPRGSQWRPIGDAAHPPTLVNAPDGATATFYYSTVQDYCMDDIENPSDEPVCPTDDPTTGWVAITPGTTEDVYREMTALKVVVTFEPDSLFQPTQVIAVEGTTATPAVVPPEGDHSIAWNSAAVSGVAQGTQGSIDLLPTEGTKVGVASASGSLRVEKQVIGDGAEYAPDVFHLEVACTSAVGTFLETALEPIPIDVTPGTPVIVPDLPYGAECTITENASNGQTQLIVGSKTIGEDPEIVDLVAVNRYDLASLVVSKEVVSDAADQNGDPISFGPFDVQVRCTFLGNPVYADGYGPDDPMDLTIEDGDEITLTGLPVGADCTVTETGTGNATEVDVTVQEGSRDPVHFDGPQGDVTLVGDLAGGPRNTADLVNTYDVGGLDLTKVVTGDGVERYGAGPFRLNVRCTFDDDGIGSDPPRVVYDSPVVLGGAGPLDAQIPDLPVGALCRVTEPDDGGATTTTIRPAVVRIGSGDPVEVTATNTFDLGGITVDKVVAGQGGEDFGAGPFEVSVACTYDGEAIGIPGGATRPLVPGEQLVYSDLPVGAQCTVEETVDGEASSTSIAVTTGDDDPVVTDGTSADVVVPPNVDGEATAVAVVATNTFDDGAVTVDKVVDGDGASLYGSGPFEVSLACTFDGNDVDIPDGAERELVPGTPVTYDGLPVGADCTVTETATGGATSTVVSSVGDGAAGAVVVPEGDPATVTVTNTFDVGEVRVVKTLSGNDAAAHVGDTFTVTLACTQDVDGEDVAVDIPGGATRTLSDDDDWVAVYEDVPQGADCVVAETDAGSADSVEIVVAGQSTVTDPDVETPQSASFALPVGDDVCAPVDVVNTWSAGGGTGTGGGGSSAAAGDPGAADGCDDAGGGPASGGIAITGIDALVVLGWMALLTASGIILVRLRQRGRA